VKPSLPNEKKAAILLTALLVLLCLGCLICLRRRGGKENYIAEIYQEGELLMSIPLYKVQESRTFTIEGKNGCVNEVEVRPGSIGILSADCPDKICVSQGFISDSRLPITCLPNRLVILLRPVSGENTEPDILTY